MKVTIFLFVSFFMIGCMTTEKATSFLKKKDKLDDVCAENFPVKDSLIKGDTVTVVDTIVNTDTLETFETFRDTVHHTITLPAKVITKTRVVTDTVIRQDNAKINALEDNVRDRDKTIGERDNKITVLGEKLSDMTGKRNKWRIWFWVLLGAAGLYTLLKLKRIISF
jgi:hypothetical protein